jgi:hypothetical protein
MYPDIQNLKHGSTGFVPAHGAGQLLYIRSADGSQVAGEAYLLYAPSATVDVCYEPRQDEDNCTWKQPAGFYSNSHYNTSRLLHQMCPVSKDRDGCECMFFVLSAITLTDTVFFPALGMFALQETVMVLFRADLDMLQKLSPSVLCTSWVGGGSPRAVDLPPVGMDSPIHSTRRLIDAYKHHLVSNV